jgi:hypothetical protein
MWHAVAFRTALLALLLPVAGCATAQVTYDKPGVTQAERKQDENECLRAAIGSGEQPRFLAVYQIDREVYVRCLQARGYTAKRE